MNSDFPSSSHDFQQNGSNSYTRPLPIFPEPASVLDGLPNVDRIMNGFYLGGAFGLGVGLAVLRLARSNPQIKNFLPRRYQLPIVLGIPTYFCSGLAVIYAGGDELDEFLTARVKDVVSDRVSRSNHHIAAVSSQEESFQRRAEAIRKATLERMNKGIR
jgi:hypothetical protein